MLPFTDETWKKLDGSGLIRELMAGIKNDFQSDSKTELLYGQLCHQFSIAPAAYALMPYLLEIAETNEDIDTKVEVVLFGGTIHSFSDYERYEDNSLKIIALHQMKIDANILQKLEIEYFESLQKLKGLCFDLLEGDQIGKQDRGWLFIPLVSYLGQRKFSQIFESGSFDEYVLACPNCENDIYLMEENGKLVGYDYTPEMTQPSRKFDFFPANIDWQNWNGQATRELKYEWMLFLAERYKIEPIRFQLPYLFSQLNCPNCHHLCDIFEGICDYE